MKQLIFDTNFLREWFYIQGKKYSQEEASKFKTLLKSKGFIVHVPNHVVIELLCNLLKNDIEAKESSFFALKILSYLSINKVENDQEKRNMSPGFQAIYCNYFFGEVFEQISNNEFFINALFWCYLNDEDKSQEKNYLKIIDDCLKKQKEDEILQLLNHVKRLIKKYNNGVVDWKSFKNEEQKKQLKSLYKSKELHRDFLESQLLSVVLYHKDDSELPKMRDLKTGMKDFKIALDFYISFIYQELVMGNDLDFTQNMEVRKKWNSFYDYQLILACEYENAFNKETILITNDGSIVEVFKKHKKENLVMKRDDFLNSIYPVLK